MLVTLGDSTHGAGTLASAAADTIATDHIGHWEHLQYKTTAIVPQLFKIAMLIYAQSGYIFYELEKIHRITPQHRAADARRRRGITKEKGRAWTDGTGQKKEEVLLLEEIQTR